MDKYAVDLDQLLNDFEYSELTDNYPIVQRNIESTSLSQNGIVKHSINNVFHSLNEYLNTDITPKPSSTVFEPNLVDSSTNIQVSKDNNNEALCGSLEVENNEELIDISSANEEIKVDKSTKQIIEETKEIIEENLTHIEEVIENVENEEIEDQTTEIIEDQTTEIIDVEQSQNLSKTSSEDSVILEDLKEEEINLIKEETNVIKEEEIDAIKEETNVITEEEINLVEEDTNVNAIEELVEDVVAIEENSIKEEETKVATVGFDEELEINEAELNDMLEQLEDEFEDTHEELQLKNEETVDIKENIATETVTNKIKEIADNEEPSDTLKDNDEIIEKSQKEIHRPDHLPLNIDAEVNVKKIDLIGEPGSTPYNNVYKDLAVCKAPVPPSADEVGSDAEKASEVTSSAPPVTRESDSEFSSSSSSTSFSDASSSDTASTCSADNVSTAVQVKQYKKDPRNKASMSKNRENPKSEEENTATNSRVENLEVVATENELSSQQNDTEEAVGLSDEVVNDLGENLAQQHRENTDNDENTSEDVLGDGAPYWMPDHESDKCLHCDAKFTVIKRRHHCRACGKLLCSKCCNQKHRLRYLDAEARVCHVCLDELERVDERRGGAAGGEGGGAVGASSSPPAPRRPNPNNPEEYCSTVSPLEQMGAASLPPPPVVMVPASVLKRKGSNKTKHNKTVMFCDGIRPGSDLTNLDNDFNYSKAKLAATKKPEKSAPARTKPNLPQLDPVSKSFIPKAEQGLPPIATFHKSEITYKDCDNTEALVESLRTDKICFALNLNLFVHVKIVNMDCCVNKVAWCFSSEGLINVGQDEVVYLLEVIEGENQLPKDMFHHINSVYLEAVKGSSVKELGLSLHSASNFLDSKNHAGFVYIKPTFQCLQNIVVPKEPYLIGILIHRWETPWAKLFPLRLILRFGALYRYYPSPIISTRHRDSVFVEIGHTIINLLADFRNYSYTLPQIRGLTIHMEDKNTTVTIPVNRYDQVMRSVNNSTDHILAFAGNFSQEADSHLVCIQDTQNNENCYSTHAINIHSKPRKITGASFIVFNGALKSSSGLTAKSNIVEDGLMIQVLPEHMLEIRDSLRSMRNFTVKCGCVDSTGDESVHIAWGNDELNFNSGVFSSIDDTSMAGVPSIRVHNGKDFVSNCGRLIKWTEVFIIQNNDDSQKNRDPVDISKVSENIAKATCSALVKYLDLLVSNSIFKIGIRTTLHVENVSYLAGGNNKKLPPIYMKSLDNELIPVLHRITSNNLGENAIVLELVFRILNT